jgi:disulfide oxidoreductase YuzD
MPLPKRDIKVVIANDSTAPQCDAECGTDWSAAEAIDLARQQIQDRFGGDIKLEYIDLSQPAAHADAPALRREIRDKTMPLPLLLINGQPRISGLFDIRQLMDTIEVELELEA